MHDFYAEEQLLIALRGREGSRAFSALYAKYMPMLVDYASIKLEDLEEARDMLHDIFVQLWETRDNLDIHHSFKAYLFTLLKRRIVSHYRRHRYRLAYAESLGALADTSIHGPDSFAEASEIQRMVDRALPDMPKRVREIYQMSRDSHMSNKEIASYLNISEKTVKNQLGRAMAILKDKLKKMGAFLLLVLIGLFLTIWMAYTTALYRRWKVTFNPPMRISIFHLIDNLKK